jgi:hypothetical protein
MSRKKKIDTKHYSHAICPLNVVPVWYRPSADSPMISQMLYGETCTILEKKNKYWYKIQTTTCNITGWISAIQITLTDEATFIRLSENPGIALEICHPIFNDEDSKSIVIGSSLPAYDGISFQMPENKYIYNGQATFFEGLELSPDLLVKIARKYLFSPELSGGRSPFGIDSGALIQNVFKFFGVFMPRYPHEQYLIGDVVDFVELAQEGDLVYCQNNEGHIHHVGMVVGDKKVLHVYGCARIDKLDHHGFYNVGLQKYTHKLRIIKRVI